jgi:hypothetical protein
MSEKESVLSWRCKNPGCLKIFHLSGRILSKPPPQGWVADVVSVEKPCCPFCQSLDFEPIRVHVKFAEETTKT